MGTDRHDTPSDCRTGPIAGDGAGGAEDPGGSQDRGVPPFSAGDGDRGRDRFRAMGAPAILPSLLLCDFLCLEGEIRRLTEAGVEGLHLDVMDGHFVPNLTYGRPIVEAVRRGTDLPLDVHLMLLHPASYLDDFIEAGADAVTVHVECRDAVGRILERLRSAGVAAGVACNPDTPLARLAPYLGLCDYVLVMSVQPGFGGQRFRKEAVEKLRRLRDTAPDGVALSVDGGISPATIGRAATGGASRFVVGSALFRASDYREMVARLKDRARAGTVSEDP